MVLALFVPLITPARAEASGETVDAAAAIARTLTSEEATVWYLAEGFTGGEFDTWVLVQNPGEEDADVTLNFQLPPGSKADPYSFNLPAGTRQSIKLDGLPGLSSTDVSTKVTATRPVVAERAMYFSYNGKAGGHDSIGVKYPASEWFLAEGFTGGEFDTWVLVQNPSAADTTVTLDFQLPPGSSAPSYRFDLPAGTRKSINLDTLPGLASTDVSTHVSSPIAVVAERAMYFDYQGKPGGHDSAGVSKTSNNWYLAEGYTGGEFDTYVLVQNPGEQDTRVTFTFQLPPGSSAPPFSFDIPAGTRQSIMLDGLPGLANTDVSTTVSADKPVVAERAVYFDYFGKKDGHDCTGATRPECDWYLAEGYTGGDFDTYVLVQNPGETDKQVTLHFQLPPGSSADPYTFTLNAGTRKSIMLDGLPGLSNTDVSTWVDADGPVVAERAEYFTYEGKSGGHCSIGAVYEPPVIPATTKVLTQAEIDHLVSVVQSGDKRIVTFDGSTAIIDDLMVGDVILSDSPNAPDGFLYKIVELGRGGGVTTLTVISAGLEEAILQGNISLSGSKVPGAAAADAFNTASLVHFDEDLSVSQKIGTGANYVDLTGSVGIELDLDFSIDIDYTPPSLDWVKKYQWGVPYWVPDVTLPSVELKSVAFGASFTEEVAVDVTIHGDFSADEFVMTIPGTKIDLPEIKFMAGPVPVWLTPYIQLAVGVDGHIDMGVTAGVTQTSTIAAGCSWNSASGWKPPDPDFSSTFTIRYPEPSGTFTASDCTFSFGPQVGILLYSVLGPYVNILAGERITGDPNTAHPGKPLLAMYAALDVDIGIKFGIEVGIYKWVWTYWLVNEKFRAIEWDLLLFKSVWIYGLSPTEGEVGSLVTINGTGFGNTRENDSYVSFGGKKPTEYISWSDNQIKCRVPAGVYGTVKVKVTHIFHKWGPLVIKITSNGVDFTAPGGGGGGPGTWDAQASGTMEYLNGVSAYDASHVWAVGSNGTVRFFNGTSWGNQNSGTTQPLYDVEAAAANRVWAVGYQGTLRYYNGSNWSGQSSGTINDLNGLYAADTTHVWAVGNGGTIRFYDGSSWGNQASGTANNLYSVMGTDASHVWAVGADDTVLFYDGSSWSKLTGTPGDTLGDIWVADEGNIWAVGVNLYYYDGSTWDTHYSGLSEGLVSVAALSDNQAWVGAWYGTIRFWDGTDWVVQDVADSSVDIMDIEILNPTHMWAVGSSGTILFNNGT
jgi:IPT/TIG domain/Family of unknown function (DUF5719)